MSTDYSGSSFFTFKLREYIECYLLHRTEVTKESDNIMTVSMVKNNTDRSLTIQTAYDHQIFIQNSAYRIAQISHEYWKQFLCTTVAYV